MKMRPRVSIIIPARNAERTLAETLTSLIAQTDAGWEAIVVDDGSTDATSTIIGEFVSRDLRFVAVVGRGEGASSARNVGLSHARGKWVLFLDSDDWIAPAFLAVMVGALDDRPDAIAAYCGGQRVTPTGELVPLSWTGQIAQTAFDVFARRCGVAIHCVLVNRRSVMELGGFDISLRTCEDWDLWQRVARAGGRFVGVAQPLAYYRMSDRSLSRDVAQMIADARIVINRGFAPDPRVGAAAKRHAAGTSSSCGQSADLAFAYFCLWCAVVEVGAGRDGRSLFSGDLAFSDSSESATAIEQIIFDALVVGARCPPRELAIRWPSFGEHLVSLIKFCAAGSPLPGFARRLQYRIERQILRHYDLSTPVSLALTMGLRVDIRDLSSVEPPSGVDLLYVYLCEGDRVLGIHELPVFGIITARQLASLAIQTLGLRRFQDGAKSSRKPRFWWHVAKHSTRLVRERLAGRAPRGSLRAIASETLRIAAIESAGSPMVGRASDYILAELVDQARREGQLAGGPGTTSFPTPPGGETTKPLGDRAQYWDALFEGPDPWNYGSDYEQLKYHRQLSLLPHKRIGRALEVACAEGWFTEQLADRVDQLIAIDISERALERARRRCANRSNISFERLDFYVEAIPQRLDLIVCSEVLYYLDSEAELAQICRSLTAALGPDGHLLTAHAFVLKDNLDRTAFDWEQPFGAEVIARAFENTPEVALVRSLQTELYRIDLYRRLREGELRLEPAVEILPIGAKLDGEVARCIVWGGATARRADLFASESTDQVPVLMYHRVAEDGPRELARYRVSRTQFLEQMRWLRRQGYHTISSADLAWHFESGLRLGGRPVLITFDDGTQDFHDTAWPILRDCDFTAEVFVVTDFIGRFAEWDRSHGVPAALMTREQILALSQTGTHFGSHLASHIAIDRLTSRQLAVELARSRAALEAWLRQPIQSFAAPFGVFDERLFRLADFCGYRSGFTTEDGVAQLGGDPLRLPRIEIQGEWGLSEFIQAIGRSR
jgi:peptidoglycan/xylan/chitin deacetylase (PgdA/CDA1 family)/GT2 family glycosyltransferase/trans-aconitate methyltransferase